jgi:hypothetical protein
MTLTQIAFWAFAAIASGGLLMTVLILLDVRWPSILPIGHGLGGLTALGILFTANLKGGSATPDRAWWALAVFTTGLVGGVVLFRILFKDKATLPLALMHGSLGAIGLWLLYGVAAPF